MVALLFAYLEASPSNIVSFGRLKWDATVKALSNKPACVNNATLSCGDNRGPETRKEVQLVGGSNGILFICSKTCIKSTPSISGPHIKRTLSCVKKKAFHWLKKF